MKLRGEDYLQGDAEDFSFAPSKYMTFFKVERKEVVSRTGSSDREPGPFVHFNVNEISVPKETK